MSSWPGDSWYGSPARRSADRTSNSHASRSCSANAAPRARSRCRASRDTRDSTCERRDVEVGALAAPGDDDPVDLVAGGARDDACHLGVKI